MSDLQKTLGRSGQSPNSPPGSDVVQSDTVGELRKAGDFRDVAIPPGMPPTRKDEKQGDPYAKPYRISPVFEVQPAGGADSQYTALAGEGNGRFQAPVDFEAHSIIVDNWSNQYLYFPTANKWVAPFQIDKILGLPRGATSIDVKFIAPARLALPPVVAGHFVAIQAYEGFLSPSGGTDVTAIIGAGLERVDIQQIVGTQLTVGGFFDNAGAPGAALPAFSYAFLFNNATYDRQRSASAANLGAQSGLGAALVTPPGQWTVVSTPAVGTVASAVKAAGGAGVRHVCTGITFSAAAAAAPAATLLTISIRDGASGAGTILKTYVVFIPAAIGEAVSPIDISGMELVGSANTAMTVEWSAGLANLQETVTLIGHDAS